jgi:hypothetical protein
VSYLANLPALTAGELDELEAALRGLFSRLPPTSPRRAVVASLLTAVLEARAGVVDEA